MTTNAQKAPRIEAHVWRMAIVVILGWSAALLQLYYARRRQRLHPGK